MLKIYFNEKPLFIAQEITDELQPYLDDLNTVSIRSTDASEVSSLIKEIQQPEKAAAIILSNEKEALEAIKKQFVIIQAAGGLVCTSSRELLLIYRRGKWDLPKGKLDEGENLEECAVREVEEETGLQRLILEKPLCITYHTYKQDEQFILKESHWYLMRTEKEQVFTPQTDEDIEKCEWVALDKLSPYLENTHPSIIDVINAGKNQIKQ